MAYQGSHRLPVRFLAAVLLFSRYICCAGENLIDASNSLHPLSVSIQLPPFSQCTCCTMQ
jgi:hypothetical protein